METPLRRTMSGAASPQTSYRWTRMPKSARWTTMDTGMTSTVWRRIRTMGYWHDMNGSDYAWMIGMMFITKAPNALYLSKRLR